MTEKQEPNWPPTSAEASAAVAASVRAFNEAMAWARTSFAIGNSFMHYRREGLEEASLAIHSLPREQRDMVYQWAAWLVGQGE